jgi:hypothetical protein
MKRVPIGIILLFAIAFVGFGDQVLPKSIGKYSTAARVSLDNMMVSGFPQWNPKSNQYRKTNEAVDNLDKR